MVVNTHAQYDMTGQPHDQTLLPMMTALFIDGLGPNRRQVTQCLEGLNNAIQAKRHGKIYRLPLYPEEQIQDPDVPGGRSGKDIDRHAIPGIFHLKRRDSQSAVRSLVAGMSHHFNNIIMGIWGNIALLRSNLDQTKPVFTYATRMEQLIGNGTFLIHTVLGYLAERRYAIREIRLKQLIQEIQEGLGESSVFKGDPREFESHLQWAFTVQGPRMIASSTARVLDVILEGIDGCYKDLSSERHSDKEIVKRLNKIKALVLRGSEMTRHLNWYAGNLEGDLRQVKLAPLVRRVVREVGDATLKAMTFNVDISRKLKMVKGDRETLLYALKQVLENACSATHEKGSIYVAVRPLHEEPSLDRCCVQKGGDYMVISITDQGAGIPERAKQHIFEPYFAYPNSLNRKGLGLAAADGIIKAHGGYIQVQSDKDYGSTLRLYLPCAGTALQHQTIKITKA